MDDKRNISINVPVLARVEGEGALDLVAKNGQIEKLNLHIYEPPRLFEKLLEGRLYSDVPDSVARICGICPVAYQMSAVQALENIFKVQVSHWTQTMRRVMYCGEWIQSHALHIHLLAAPDFFGCDSVISLSQQFPGEVKRGLKLQSLGNKLIALFGGRSVHPVGVNVGGFFHAPDIQTVARLRSELIAAVDDAKDLVIWTAGIAFPDHEQEFTSVALQNDSEYAIYEGQLVSSEGLSIGIEEYQQHFREFQQPHSTALHSLLEGKPYLVGPLARVNLNLEKLNPNVTDLLDTISVKFPSRNMFHSMIARAIEIYHALLTAIDLLEDYQVPDAVSETYDIKAGTGYGCSEAPRGILWHSYTTNDTGHIEQATIIPPTSQNQARIEQDLRVAINHFGLHRSDDELRLRAESIIRNYDPCISCATHFLRLNIERNE